MAKSKQPSKPEKQLVERRECTDIPSGGTLNEWIDTIQGWIVHYGPNTRLEIDAGYESVVSEIIYNVPETDKEFERRLKIEAQLAKKVTERAEKQAAAELKEYNRLKKKFG